MKELTFIKGSKETKKMIRMIKMYQSDLNRALKELTRKPVYIKNLRIKFNFPEEVGRINLTILYDEPDTSLKYNKKDATTKRSPKTKSPTTL